MVLVNCEELIIEMGQAETDNDATLVEQLKENTPKDVKFGISEYSETATHGLLLGKQPAAVFGRWMESMAPLTERTTITSSETHQSLLILKGPVFRLVLHHCRNIPTEHSELQAAGCLICGLRRLGVALCHHIYGVCVASFLSRNLLHDAKRIRACSPDERTAAGCRLSPRSGAVCGRAAKHHLPPPPPPPRGYVSPVTGLHDVLCYF